MHGFVPTIHLVDDDAGVLKALRRLFEAEGFRVAAFLSAEDFFDHHDPLVPGCAILDLGLPGMDGFGILQRLSSDIGQRPVIFLTGRGDIPASVKAMKAGAVNFLTKPPDADALLAAVAEAVERDVQDRQQGDRQKLVESRLAGLTPREREVLTGVVAGLLNKQIGANLGIVEKTVKVHRGRMMAKMGVRTVADLVRLMGGERN